MSRQLGLLEALLLIGSLQLGCDAELPPQQPAPAANPAGAPSSTSAAGASQASAGAPGAGGGATHDWSLLPFRAGGGGVGGIASGATAGTAGAVSGGGGGAEVPASCEILCDCVIDVCGNVLRIFEHGHCLPGCTELNDSQRACRLNECLQGGSDLTAAAHCDHAIGNGANLPGACAD